MGVYANLKTALQKPTGRFIANGDRRKRVTMLLKQCTEKYRYGIKSLLKCLRRRGRRYFNKYQGKQQKSTVIKN